MPEHSLTELLKKCKYQQQKIGTKKCDFGGNLEIVFEIISLGHLLVMSIDFHVDLILNFAIPIFLGHPVVCMNP